MSAATSRVLSSRKVTFSIDGRSVSAAAGTTILEVARSEGIEIPTLCQIDTLAPVNVCRVCVVEVKGARTLVPACSRQVSEGMEISTGSERVNTARRMVLELLASSVDLSLAGADLNRWMSEYGAAPERHGEPDGATGHNRDKARPGEHEVPDGSTAATVAQPVKKDNPLYVRDYSRCILCYKCVEACGPEAQNTFAISTAGRGFDARISTEFNVGLEDSACVFCGNCIAVCPTGALMFTSEHEMRAEGSWDESAQSVTRTVCPYCGVGCNLELHVQDNRVVKVTSPLDHSVTEGNLCIKGRFGYDFAQPSSEEPVKLG